MNSSLTVPFPRIIDSTLREGSQGAGVRFSPEQSVEIAQSLVRAGVDTVECGHPMAGEAERRRVRATVTACGSVPVLSHARACVEDIDCVAATGAAWVGIFVGVNQMSRRSRIGPGRHIPTLIRNSVAHARSLGLKARFTVEDGSRTPWEELVEAYRIALESGADRLCFADTVGALCPWETGDMVRRLVGEFRGVDLEVHFHDDRGMANANALEAVRAGARWVSCSVNGIGERCGITETVLLLSNLAIMGWRPSVDGPAIQHLSALVQAHSRLPVDRRRPVVGRNAFTHVSRLHRRAVQADERAYAWTAPETVGRTSSTDPAILPSEAADLINQPDVVSATELRHHRRGPGDRYLMLDDRVVRDCRQYCIVRHIPPMEDFGPGHVDVHRHSVDSLFLFLGQEKQLRGLTVEVRLGNENFEVRSPASVFIPAGLAHSYRVLSGSGLFVNHVLEGDYNSSLLDMASPDVDRATPDHAAAGGRPPVFAASTALSATELRAFEILVEFVRDRRPGFPISPDAALTGAFDSLLFLDFFLHIETVYGASVSLDDVSACITFGEVAKLLSRGAPVEALADCQ